MTEIQYGALKRLVGRYNKTFRHLSVVHGSDELGLYGLPKGWISFILYNSPESTGEGVILAGGVSPEGNIAT
jgi:hypothetical protein